MNAQTEIQPYAYDPSSFDHAAFHGFAPPPGATRHEGWTPDKQRRFLEALSEGHTVVQACAIVGLSKQSAYALRHSPRGQSFAIGWEAAILLARGALPDDLMERAFRGTRETVTDDDGRIVTRHRHDNRLAMAMLNRLDRMAEAAASTAATARLVAGEFAQYLELIERDAGPARAGVFLGARIAPADEAALAPVRALARADKWLRTHIDLADPPDTAELDPAERAHWTAGQWAAAEVEGMVRVDAGENRESSQASQAEDEEPVWWNGTGFCWETSFPPPTGFAGYQDGVYGDADYARSLTPEEEAAWEAGQRAELAQREAVESVARDRFFGLRVDAEPAEAPAPPAAPAAPPAARPARSSAPAHKDAASCVEPPTAHPRARTGAPTMSIFGSIKDAIFGHKAAAAPAPAPAPAPAGQAPAAPQPAPAAAAPAGPVDVESVLMVFETERGTADLNWRTSIVDLMKLLGLDSSLENRKQLATELGYTGATDGSAEMNIWLHKAVMQKLAENGGNVPASLKG